MAVYAEFCEKGLSLQIDNVNSMDENVIRSIKDVAKTALPENSRLLLYGSRARGDSHAGSDWDLLILLDKPRIEADDYDNVAFPFTMLGWDINEMISPHLYTKRQWDSWAYSPFYKNVERDKIILV